MSSPETAVYRVIAKDGAWINGAMRAFGTSVEYRGWPKLSELEAASPIAARIIKYYRKRQAQWGGLPASPFSAAHKGFYLPGMPPQFDHAEPPGLVHGHEVDASLPALPEYTVEWPRWLGKREYEPGEIIRWIGWPDDGMTAANQPAELVAAYFAEHQEHPQLEKRGPWCWARGLHLPKLEPLRPCSPPVAENVGAIASEVARATGQPGGVIVGRDELPPYANSKYTHLFKDVSRTHVNRAKQLPDRKRTVPDSSKTLNNPAQE